MASLLEHAGCQASRCDEPAVVISGVSKRFKLFSSPVERLMAAIRPGRPRTPREFWALQDINLTIPAGQTLGIIGRNGSGKSTLLQIICAILRPTRGQVRTRGRIAALLELGAGFNPEFTGRDNAVFLCRLSGLEGGDITGRLEQIEAFADIGPFFNQPVKTYSSGMFVRLAFATAINVQPDILVVDEALAVGDAKFQRKCYQKFLDFQKAGKTILLVTHSCDIIARHCDRAVLLESGRLIMDGDAKAVGEAYNELLFGLPVGSGSRPESRPQSEAPQPSADANQLQELLEGDGTADVCPTRRTYNKNEYKFGEGGAAIVDYLLIDGPRQDPATVNAHQIISMYFKATYERDVAFPTFGLTLQTLEGMIVCGSSTNLQGLTIQPIRAGETRVFKVTMRLALKAGDYFFSCGVADHGDELHLLQCRSDMIHLVVQSDRVCSGVADLEITLSQMDQSALLEEACH